MTFLCLYISGWWRQTWDTPLYFTVVNQTKARISTEHGISYDIIWYDMIRYNKIWYDKIWWCDVMWCNAMRCDAICDVISVMCYLFRYFSTISVWLCGKYFNVDASSWINELIHSFIHCFHKVRYDTIWYDIWYDMIPKILYQRYTPQHELSHVWVHIFICFGA